MVLKYSIEVECETKWEKEAIMDCERNKLIIETLYDSVFKPIIKYGDDSEMTYCANALWNKVYEHIEKH